MGTGGGEDRGEDAADVGRLGQHGDDGFLFVVVSYSVGGLGWERRGWRGYEVRGLALMYRIINHGQWLQNEVTDLECSFMEHTHHAKGGQAEAEKKRWKRTL